MHTHQISRPRVIAAIAAVLACTAATLASGAVAASAGTTPPQSIQAAMGGNGAPPSFDDFTAAGTITGLTGTVTASTVGATGQTGEPTATCPNQNGPGTLNSVWFRWTAPTTTRIQFDTQGSGYDTFLNAYTGGSLGTLTQRACNDNGPGLGTNAAMFFNVTAGTTYRIRLDGSAANTGEAVLKWKEVPTIHPQYVGGWEGDTGTSFINVGVNLSAPTNVTVTVAWTTMDNFDNTGFAVSGSDYIAASGTVTFNPGETSKFVPVEIIGDTVTEPALYFGEWGLLPFNDASATYAKVDNSFLGLGLFIIIDDDTEL